jgi:hypothetical protein
MKTAGAFFGFLPNYSRKANLFKKKQKNIETKASRARLI